MTTTTPPTPPATAVPIPVPAPRPDPAPDRPPTVRIRPLRPDDGDAVDVVFEGLSAHSRFLRFHAPVPRLSGSLRRWMLDVDAHARIALVAEARPAGGGRAEPLGIARLIHTADGDAEIAVAVVDAWHRRGVGRALLTAVRAIAEEQGLRRVTALVLPENVAVQALIGSVFPLHTVDRDGSARRITCYLHPDALAAALTDIMSRA